MAACYLLGEIAFGETSEIYKQLVLNQQRVQFIAADFSSARDPQLLSIWSMIKKEDDIDNIKAEIYQTIDNFKRNPVSNQKLADLKSRLKYSFLMGLETPDAVAGRLARYIALTGGIQAVDQLYATYERVTPEDILNVANKFLVEQKRTVVVLKGGQK